MSKKVKVILLVVVLVVVTGFITAYMMWNKKHRDVADEKGMEVTAVQLVKEFQASETDANKKYLDKAIQVSGIISKTEKNQEGNTTVLLSSEDPFSGVYCTLKENNTGLKENSQVVIKGLCSGMLSDVRLREAIIVK